METGSGVIEELRGDVREWYDCRVFRVAFSTGAVVAAVRRQPPESVLRCTRRQSARYTIQTGAGGVVAIQRVGNAMLSLNSNSSGEHCPEKRASCRACRFPDTAPAPGSIGFAGTLLRLRNLAERNAAAPAFTFADNHSLSVRHCSHWRSRRW